MKLLNEDGFIEAGWMVNPNLYKDSEAHFYARFGSITAGGCFNLLCPGFVQVSKDVPLGVIPDKYSKIGQDNQYTSIITIHKHEDGHWWLSIDSDNKLVGYWPNTLFVRSLKNWASQIEWGGEINNPESGHTPEPYMGSGLSARDDTKLSAFYCQIKAARSQTQYDNDPKPTEKYQECDDDGYQTYDVGYQGDVWGRLTFFGGPFATMT
ncbi:Indole-3-glycerol phosphate synthase [Bienertia sinuspersici]